MQSLQVGDSSSVAGLFSYVGATSGFLVISLKGTGWAGVFTREKEGKGGETWQEIHS